MLQPVLQPRLLLRRKPPELRVVFEGAALLRGREILISAKPVSGVPGLVLRRTRLSGRAGIRAIFFLKPVPLPVRPLGLLTRWGRRLRWPRLYLGERRGQQQKRCQTAHDLCPAQHALTFLQSQLQLARGTSAAKAAFTTSAVTAALKRCATQKQMRAKIKRCVPKIACCAGQNQLLRRDFPQEIQAYGFAVTSSCTCSSSSTSKSAYNSSFLSNACRSPTAVPGCTGRPRDGGLVAMASV
jgi:hypothetical protein